MSRDEVILIDIRSAVLAIGRFCGGLDRDQFLRDEKTQSAVLHQLILIGEAAKRLSDDFREGHPAIDWKGYAGLRDVLTHQYDVVDLGQVWQTVSAELPELAVFLESQSLD